jgi:uncharacterized Tic20 family protein
MTYMAHEGPDTTMAGVAHLGAMLGPVVPFVVWLARRREDAFSAREAAAATNFGAAVLAAFVAGTLIRLFVPLVGFLGTLTQLAVLIVAVFFSVQAFRGSQRGTPASYPFDIKVVKTDE